MKPGDNVTVEMSDGAKVDGQVWSLADVPGYVWVALDTGRYAAVRSGGSIVVDTPSGNVIGKVAA